MIGSPTRTWKLGDFDKWFIEYDHRGCGDEDCCSDGHPWRVLWPWNEYCIRTGELTAVWRETRFRTGAEALAAFNRGLGLDIERNLEGVVTCQNL